MLFLFPLVSGSKSFEISEPAQFVQECPDPTQTLGTLGSHMDHTKPLFDLRAPISSIDTFFGPARAASRHAHRCEVICTDRRSAALL